VSVRAREERDGPLESRKQKREEWGREVGGEGSREGGILRVDIGQFPYVYLE